MARIVMKFGGTSMAGIERIRNVAARVKREVEAGHQVAVVVSAMAGETDRLVGFCREASPLHDPREYDVVVASGEQVTSGLLAIVLQAIDVPARSWLGWQLPIHTSDAHSVARIVGIDTAAVEASMAKGEVAVIPGFQGLADGNRVTTLGRGGSDTSAVAVAAALKAERCDIYTDVDGVYTTDPRIVPRARKLERVTYEEMLELASVGAKVLQTRSVELAMAHRVPVRVLSSFVERLAGPDEGTLICDEDEIVEKRIVSGVAMSRDEAKITLFGVPDRIGVTAEIFSRLADANLNVDMIVQSSARSADRTNLIFTVGRRDAAAAQKLMQEAQAELGFDEVRVDQDVAKVSVIGVGMRSHAGVAKSMFQALADKGIQLQAISTSEIKVSVLISSDYAELAVRALHAAYGLAEGA